MMLYWQFDKRYWCYNRNLIADNNILIITGINVIIYITIKYKVYIDNLIQYKDYIDNLIKFKVNIDNLIQNKINIDYLIKIIDFKYWWFNSR